MAPFYNAKLIKNYENFSNVWRVEKENIVHLDKQNLSITTFSFLEKDTLQVERYQDKKKTFQVLDNSIVLQQTDFSKEFLMSEIEKFLNVENFFYLKFIELFPLVLQKDKIFSYIFFQKIADILNPLFLLLIFLGKPLHPRNTDLEKKMISRSLFCILFLFTSQIGFFLFRTWEQYPFFFAFFNHIFWAFFLIVRYINNVFR